MKLNNVFISERLTTQTNQSLMTSRGFDDSSAGGQETEERGQAHKTIGETETVRVGGSWEGGAATTQSSQSRYWLTAPLLRLPFCVLFFHLILYDMKGCSLMVLM